MFSLLKISLEAFLFSRLLCPSSCLLFNTIFVEYKNLMFSFASLIPLSANILPWVYWVSSRIFGLHQGWLARQNPNLNLLERPIGYPNQQQYLLHSNPALNNSRILSKSQRYEGRRFTRCKSIEGQFWGLIFSSSFLRLTAECLFRKSERMSSILWV